MWTFFSSRLTLSVPSCALLRIRVRLEFDTRRYSMPYCAGFYCADTVSLSFGALSVNDVVAAAVTVAFCEVVSYVYYQARPGGTCPALPLRT